MLTEAQQALVRSYCGYTGRFRQFDTRLEQAMRAISTLPESEALITNDLEASPPGLLACCLDVDAKLTASHRRLKVSKVGPIELNPREIAALRDEGRRYVGRLCQLLGVERGNDAFGDGRGAFATYAGQGHGQDNYVGKC